MSESDLLADKIEQAIGKMFAYAGDFDSGIRDYALLFNSKKSNHWIIVFFFDDKVHLKKSLAGGELYSLHRFLQNELTLIDKHLPISIRFDIGKMPSNNMEFDQLLEKHIMEYDPLKNEKGQQQICSTCGHDWYKHKIMGHKSETASFPAEGWMTCPEEDCFCFLTWDWEYTNNEEK